MGSVPIFNDERIGSANTVRKRRELAMGNTPLWKRLCVIWRVAFYWLVFQPIYVGDIPLSAQPLNPGPLNPKVPQSAPMPESANQVSVTVALPTPAKISPYLQAALHEAEQHIERARRLAERRAFYAARQQFLLALRVIAEGLDVENQTHAHVQALTAGLCALEEADDFLPNGTTPRQPGELAILVQAHRTPVLKNTNLDHIAPSTAREAYLTYAQEQLAAAVEGQPLASKALFGLGKLYTLLAEQNDPLAKQPGPKAVVFHQAALLVDRLNYQSANELGVLLAKAGRWNEARQALELSIMTMPTATALRNLAKVYQHLNKDKEAGLALRWAINLEKQSSPNGIQQVETPVGTVLLVDQKLLMQNDDRQAALRQKSPKTGDNTSTISRTQTVPNSADSNESKTQNEPSSLSALQVIQKLLQR